ncbi:IS701 family transposase [Streptomyces sp900116325]|uniref:IS701 family transposase n=1 Tax=Streptomyces sp. 900116325 TaxID=3154295 RepID=A0ABV2UG08_9ACTN
MAGVREDLEAFTTEMFDGFFRADQRRWGQVYVRGLLLDGRRKSVEPMAARLGEDGNRQALAHFVTTSPWDPAHVRARLAWRMHDVIGPEALIVDDTGFLKDGDASACVSRQYTGTAGKVTNCQVGVSLHLARDHASAAVNWRLFMPASWDPASPEADADKTARRSRCGIPAQAGHVEKWQLALDMIDEARSWGIDIPLIVADADYGDAAAFRLGLEDRNLPYTVGISSRHTAHRAGARPVQPAYAGTGRPPKMQYPEPAQTMKDLVIAAGRAAARPVSWREGSRPGQGRSGFKARTHSHRREHRTTQQPVSDRGCLFTETADRLPDLPGPAGVTSTKVLAHPRHLTPSKITDRVKLAVLDPHPHGRMDVQPVQTCLGRRRRLQVAQRCHCPARLMSAGCQVLFGRRAAIAPSVTMARMGTRLSTSQIITTGNGAPRSVGNFLPIANTPSAKINRVEIR